MVKITISESMESLLLDGSKTSDIQPVLNNSQWNHLYNQFMNLKTVVNPARHRGTFLKSTLHRYLIQYKSDLVIPLQIYMKRVKLANAFIVTITKKPLHDLTEDECVHSGFPRPNDSYGLSPKQQCWTYFAHKYKIPLYGEVEPLCAIYSDQLLNSEVFLIHFQVMK